MRPTERDYSPASHLLQGLMREVFGFEAGLIVRTDDDAVLGGAVRVWNGQDVRRIDSQYVDDGLSLVCILPGGVIHKYGIGVLAVVGGAGCGFVSGIVEARGGKRFHCVEMGAVLHIDGDGFARRRKC